MQLSKNAMLVSVNIVNGGLLGERRDATASNLVQTTYGTADRRAKASKYLIDRRHKAVKRVVAASQRVREVVYKYTLPWGDDKARLLPVKLARSFEYDLKTALRELDETRQDYVDIYPHLVDSSESELGGLFDSSQYPDQDRIMEMFSSKVNYWPIPEAGHFVAEIAIEAASEAKASIEAEIESRLVEATYDMVERATEVVSKLVDKLQAFKINALGDTENSFRDSLLDNIAETANLIERMNLTENAQIKKVVKDMNRICAVTSVQVLRRNSDKYGDACRKDVLEKGQNLLAQLRMLDLKDQEISDMVADGGEYLDF